MTIEEYNNLKAGDIVRIKGKFHTKEHYNQNVYHYCLARNKDYKVIGKRQNDVCFYTYVVQIAEINNDPLDTTYFSVAMDDLVTEKDFDNKDCFGLYYNGEYIPEENAKYYCTCSDCGEVYNRDNMVYTDDDRVVCEHCYNNYYFTCSDCGGIYNLDKAREYNGSYYCERCYEDNGYDRCDESYYEEIKDYHDRPETHYYGDNGDYTKDGTGFKGYGFELEVDDGGDYDGSARVVMSKLDREVYCQHDGSIDNGFEIISHPHTKKALFGMQARMNDTMRYLISEGYCSHDARTCGLHLHASRLLFGNNEKKQRLAISKIFIFYDYFWDDILKVSRRTHSQAEDWAVRYSTANMPHKRLQEYCGTEGASRYMAVNLSNKNTVEFRLMRGTLNQKTFWATIDFLTTTIENASKVAYKDITKPEKWLDGISPETAEYIRSRGAFASVVGPREPVTTEPDNVDNTDDINNEEDND